MIITQDVELDLLTQQWVRSQWPELWALSSLPARCCELHWMIVYVPKLFHYRERDDIVYCIYTYNFTFVFVICLYKTPY